MSASTKVQMSQEKADRVSKNSLPAPLETQYGFSKEILQILNPDGTMTPSACEKLMNFHKKETAVKEVCDLNRMKQRPDDGRYYILINRKTISNTDYPGLIEKLYEHFYGFHNVTLEKFFEEWIRWRSTETSVSAKTIKEDQFLWNALVKDHSIAKVPLKDLTIQNYIEYFRSITKDRELTRKRFNNLKSILNGIQYLAIERKILTTNCLKDINYKQFAYKTATPVDMPYTEDERRRIIDHLSKNDDLYSLAIALDFHLVIRIGELKALKWTDIIGDFILAQRFMNNKNEIIEDIKGHSDQGKRYLPLTPTAKMLLRRLHAMNPDSDYIFIRDGIPLTTSTFNRRVKKCCKELGIEYRSSHKIRFATASIMHKNGMSDTELQSLLGHTTLNMTRHYLRNLDEQNETASRMSKILG